jgi:hypothetical protein
MGYDSPSKSKCFSEFSSIERFGWSNGPYTISSSPITLKLYEGTAQCDITKGQLVGYVYITFNGCTINVQYVSINSNYLFTSYHLYVGTDLTFKKDGQYSTSFGNYPYTYTPQTSSEQSSYTFHINDPNLCNNQQFYVTPHADVCFN